MELSFRFLWPVALLSATQSVCPTFSPENASWIELGLLAQNGPDWVRSLTRACAWARPRIGAPQAAIHPPLPTFWGTPRPVGSARCMAGSGASMAVPRLPGWALRPAFHQRPVQRVWFLARELPGPHIRTPCTKGSGAKNPVYLRGRGPGPGPNWVFWPNFARAWFSGLFLGHNNRVGKRSPKEIETESKLEGTEILRAGSESARPRDRSYSNQETNRNYPSLRTRWKCRRSRARKLRRFGDLHASNDFADSRHAEGWFD